MMKSGRGEVKKWAIIVEDETNFIDSIYKGDILRVFEGDFMEVMKYANKHYEDGEVDIEAYEDWLERQ